MMFAGHVGAALAIGRGERRINPGIFVFASLLLDVLLWIFVLVGWEAVTIPPNFAFTHQPEFVFPHSHGLMAALVHVPELPIAGASSMKVGLGLWQAMPVALALESVLLLTGLCLFVRGSSLLRIRKLWLIALAVLILALTLAGMTIAPPPPSPTAMAWSSLSAIAMVCGLIGWLGRLPK
jgi:hypothetical protein